MLAVKWSRKEKGWGGGERNGRLGFCVFLKAFAGVRNQNI